MHERYITFNSFHLPYFRNVYCFLCTRQNHVDIIPTIGSISIECDHSNQKHIDRSLIRANKFEIRFERRKKTLPFALISFCIQYQITGHESCSHGCRHAMHEEKRHTKTAEKNRCEHQIHNRSICETYTERNNYVVEASPHRRIPFDLISLRMILLLIFSRINYDLRWKKQRTGHCTHTGRYSPIICNFSPSSFTTFVRNMFFCFGFCCVYFFVVVFVDVWCRFVYVPYFFIPLILNIIFCSLFTHTHSARLFYLFRLSPRFDALFLVLHLISHVVFVVFLLGFFLLKHFFCFW